MNISIWKKIQYWRRKYKSTPNGWAVAYMIGEEYTNEKSNLSPSKRSKLGGHKTKIT
tara:strand:+ start:80 stop:250 length:171 start_codon:yes stop_codon:yes gene_type:complete